VKLLPPARAEVRAAMRWYEAREDGLGREFLLLLDEALRQLAARPSASPLWRSDRPYRKQLVRRFPYVVFFEVSEEAVTVVAVAHQRRRPGYWLDR